VRSGARARAPRPRAAWAGGLLLAVPALLAVALYARSLGCGFLADDFLYLHWAQMGLGALLRRVTVDSQPQMIRPLPAVGWLLGGLPGGAVWLHGLAVCVHAAAGLLVAAIVRHEAAGGTLPAAERESRRRGAVCACLFVAFPLFTEPVIWLSAGPDLWACALALAAVWVARRGEDRAGPAAAAGALFALALLAKESAIGLPLVVALLWPWREVRRCVAVMAGIAGGYLVVRLAIFAGPGGYLGPGGRSLLWSLAPREVVWNLALRLPFRVMVPWKRASALALAEPVAALVSAVLLAPLLWWRLAPAEAGRPAGAGALRPALAVAAALAPAVPFLHLEVDQENSRLLYFPVAVVALAFGLRARPASPWVRRSAIALACYWSMATLWNGRAWAEASWEVEHTLEAMARIAPGAPAGATIFVAGHDTWRGAFAWRNGIADAAAWKGLRPDLRWFLGTVAGVDRPEETLGTSLFEIGIDAAGKAVDWTPCARQLLAPPGGLLARWPLFGGDADGSGKAAVQAGGHDPVTPVLVLPGPMAAIEVRLELGSERPPAPVPGRLFWLPNSRARFNTSESAPFFLGPRAGREIVLRVPPWLAPRPRPLAQAGFWLHLPPEDLAYVRAISIAAASKVCVAPPPLVPLAESAPEPVG
jgi:hypothetical protein